MKDAMGELNMTVVTIVAIGAVAAFFTMVLWPNIRNKINDSWDNVEDVDDETRVEYDNPVVENPTIIIPNLYE